MAVEEFTDETFESDVMKSEQPVLVDFWAPYCMPCRALLPMIEELAADNEGSARIGKLNVQDNQATAVKLSVQSVPTLMVIRNGEIVERMTGMPSKAVLQEALDGAKAS